MTTYTIKDFKRELLNRGLFTTDMQELFTAIIVFPNGDWMGVSLWDGEEIWRADCAFRANGYPLWSHGTGQGMRGLPEDESGPLNEAVENFYEAMGDAEAQSMADYAAWEADGYNREAEEESLGRPLFPNEY